MINTCYEDNGKFVVIEGNRRVCACKLLLNRELIPESYKQSYPMPADATKENIEKVIINLYPNRDSVQAYLSDCHIKGVERWSSFEKQNFYNNLFNKFKDLKKVADHTTDTIKDIRKAIVKYKFFIDVFTALKSQYKDITIEGMDYLPLVNRFMDIIIGNDSEVGLDLSFDENSLKYYCESGKSDLYNKILILIGEAFLLRKDKNQSIDGQLTKVVTTELNTVKDKRYLIINDIRIPGLYKLIKEYKGVLEEMVLKQRLIA